MLTLVYLQEFSSIGKKIRHKDLRGSVRLFMKMIMTKSLASKFSWTGMGAGRKKIKKSFRDSAAFSVLKSKEIIFNLFFQLNAKNCFTFQGLSG